MAISEKKAQKELIWYYFEAHAEIGICSSFGSIVSSAFGFSPNNSTNHMEDKFVAMASKASNPIRKLRRIQRALNSLPRASRRILDALYGNYNFPPQLTSTFGTKTGAAIFNDEITNLPDLLKLCSKKLSKHKLTQQEVNSLKIIDQQKELLFLKAHQDYLTERNKHET